MNPTFRDVFLDNMNRKKMSRTLLGSGLQKHDYQFIFVSPQGAADITSDINQADRHGERETSLERAEYWSYGRWW